ncbi:MAG: hypothetical protein HY741_28940 [Chloroflexi bacterium]|nr:hypothetical protein [Chloroflexota bacterium]
MPVKTIPPSRQIRTLKTRRAVKPYAAKSSDGAQKLSAAAYLRAIKKALAEGAYLHARVLSAEGARRYPKHALLGRYATALAPPRIIGSAPATKTDLRANKAWIEKHGSRYSGKWIALRDGTLLGVADTLQDLADALGNTQGILLTKVF